MNKKEKLVAGLLGILLGSLGIHKFYLGYTKEGTDTKELRQHYVVDEDCIDKYQ